ncbi:sugar phosphate isomerase/epimerase family protein [Azotobacter vinelandii]
MVFKLFNQIQSQDKKTMKLALCTDVLANLPFAEMLDRVKSYGIQGVEMTAGGWSPCPHVRTDELLASPEKLARFRAELERRDMEIVALNCSGNPLAPPVSLAKDIPPAVTGRWSWPAGWGVKKRSS